MDIVVATRGCQNGAPGQVVLIVTASTSNDQSLSFDVPVDFAASVTQMNNNIINRAKVMLAQYGINVTAQDRIRLFGGAS